jgi:hypothetical protein
VILIIAVAFKLFPGGRILAALDVGIDGPFGGALWPRLGWRKVAVGRHDQRRALAVVDRRIVSPYEAKSLGESIEKPIVEIPNAVLVIVVLGARAP